MDFKITQQYIYELVKRTNQEDTIYPSPGTATDNDRLFMVCDGMGGHENGEVASRIVCKEMSRVILSHDDLDESMIQKALDAALDELDRNDNGKEKKMGTTMTMLMLHAGGATIAHIGDSRVYHIRPSENRILHVTSDHSLVNDLVKIGELTPEEARNSVQKNVITRAMMPNMDRRPKADIYSTGDIRPGDFFMLCSDGMLEQMEDKNLLFILSRDNTLDKKAEMLREVTKDNRDNHSTYLIRIDDVKGNGMNKENATARSNVKKEKRCLIKRFLKLIGLNN
ncbi:PP2C family protein-serine/threonine phosphatase [Xylanibacter caecicola]|uniref:PP2C family protein-serine/threonine phosphatase n=1 Tax=Xylanibacter caecicola TaxID=2736294 RepID=UPI002589E941|nr:protein phosphatase 2C domain-containing protein [Xylanibacter caecicola]